MKRSKKIVLEAVATANVSSTNYVNPLIPEGYKHVCGEWNNGFVIERCSDGSQFVWIPVGSLDSNGTLDGKVFSEKFGRRNYQDDKFSDDEFNEELNEELHKQWESVQKYGGFYISRYNISQSKTGEAKSVKEVMPWTNINWFDAMEAAKTFGDGVSVTSHLPFGAEFDSALEWFIKSGKRTIKEIANDSTQWGNFWNTRNAPKKVVKTGTREEWSTNNICDLAGNVGEWTQEQYESSLRVIRGDFSYYDGDFYPVAYRTCSSPNLSFIEIGFRATLFLA